MRFKKVSIAFSFFFVLTTQIAMAADDSSAILEQARTAITKHDLDTARALLSPLAEKGDAPAQNLLGDLCGFSGDNSQAVSWYKKAAEQGNPKAQNNLGMAYVKGQGLARNDSEGFNWLRKAADQGNVKAENNLSVLYATGRGVPKDEIESAKWCKKAAEQGDDAAQLNLAGKYQDGRGVDKDESEARKWFVKAANQGNAQAQSVIISMLEPVKQIALGVVLLRPGQDTSIEFEELNGQLIHPRLILAHPSGSETAGKPSSFDLSLSADPKTDMTILKIRNNFKHDIAYDCLIKHEGRPSYQPTSSLPVKAGLLNFESWPGTLNSVMVRNLRFAGEH